MITFPHRTGNNDSYFSCVRLPLQLNTLELDFSIDCLYFYYKETHYAQQPTQFFKEPNRPVQQTFGSHFAVEKFRFSCYCVVNSFVE